MGGHLISIRKGQIVTGNEEEKTGSIFIQDIPSDRCLVWVK
jgi:hypothetical protein